jgi:hypothetical protein
MSETTQVTKHNVWIGIDKNNYIIRIYNDAFIIPLEGDYQLSTVEHTDTEINGARIHHYLIQQKHIKVVITTNSILLIRQ